MVSKADSNESLWHFVQDIGIMDQLVTDGDPQWLTKWQSDSFESALETIDQNLVKPSPFQITLAHVKP